MHSLRIRLLATAVALTLILLSVSSPSGVARSASPYLVHITGTGIGLMFRTNPNDWNARGGPAGYDGDVAMLQCEVMGTPIGPYANRAWYTATTRFGTGWIPDHFLDTPIQANQWLPGLPSCQTSIPASIPSGTSVFFSGTDSAHGPSDVTGIADKDVALKDWRDDNTFCSPNRATHQVPDTAVTLAGWSKGRLGPIYYLAAANQAQKDRIKTIILFDPGQTSNFVGTDTCDPKYDINTLLATWLKSQDHRLIVFTGWVSEEVVYTPSREPIQSVQELTSGAAAAKQYSLTFAGLWRYYFAGIWYAANADKSIANRALVCDYFGMGHEDVVRNFAWTVKRVPTACPTAKNGQQPVSWRP